MTFEIYKEFVQDLIKLKAWYAWWLKHNTALGYDEILEKRINFFKEGNNRWAKTKEMLIEEYERQGGNTDTMELETLILKKVRTHANDAFLKKVFYKEFEKVLKESCYGIGYEFHPEYDVDGSPDFMSFHFRNYFAPDTPFNHRDKLIGGLRRTIKKAAEERPDITMAQCATWLNDVPAFSSLFPPVWKERAMPGKPGGHFGWWGQFMDRTGYLHKKNARAFRATGEFPYKHLKGKCSIAELKKYLDEDKTFA